MIARFLVLGVLAFAITFSAQSQSPVRGKMRAPQVAELVSAVFSDSDRRVLQQWVKALPPGGLPPGLAKRGELPPGLRKQLQKNGTLPPGLEKKVSPFPDDLTKRLSPLPAGCGCDRVFLDGKALIVASVTSAILDAISLF